jgi:predicted DNA-binding transcriptional regulator AlpA
MDNTVTAGDAAPSPEKRTLIRAKEAGKRCAGLSNMERGRLEKAGLFPKRVYISPTIVAYFEDEIDEWIATRIRKGGRQVPKKPVVASNDTSSCPPASRREPRSRAPRRGAPARAEDLP